jgi:hypothetical protein
MPSKPGAADAHHRHGEAVHPDGLPQDAWVRRETGPPVVVVQHDHRIGARVGLVVLAERASERRAVVNTGALASVRKA